MALHRNLFLVFGLALLTEPLFAQLQWSSPTVVSSTSIPQHNKDIRVGPDGSVYLVWDEYVNVWFSDRKVFFERRDSNLNLEIGPVQVSNTGNGSRPLLCQDANENLHIIWMDDRFHPPPFGADDLFYTLLTKDGETIVDDTSILGGGQNIGGRPNADIQFGADGYVHLILSRRELLVYRKFDLEGRIVVARNLQIPGTHYFRHARILPARDGTSHVLYNDYLDSPTIDSTIYHVKIDGEGNILHAPSVISDPRGRHTYTWLTAAIDSKDRAHAVWHEHPFHLPIQERVSHMHYRLLDADGTPITGIWTLTDEPGYHVYYRDAWMAIDDLDRPQIFCVRLTTDSWPFVGGNGRYFRREILDWVLDPFSQDILQSEIVRSADNYTSLSAFRRNSQGGWVGVYGDNRYPPDAYECLVLRTKPDWTCRNGNVDADAGFDRRTLSVAGSPGDETHTVIVSPGIPIPLAIYSVLEPPVPFYVQARAGLPSSDSVQWIPGAGLGCFDFLDVGSAISVWNGLGHYRSLGHSHHQGIPIADPPPSPGPFFTIPASETIGLPPGTTVTFQGVQWDGRSSESRGFAVTNAVILRIQ